MFRYDLFKVRIDRPDGDDVMMRSGGSRFTPRSRAIIDCAALLVLAAVPRCVRLGHASLWIDELFSVCWSQLDWHFLLGEGARVETNPPTYYLLLHGWMDIFGTTEIAVRALSVLLSSVTVLVVYALGRIMMDRPTALLAGLLMAVNPVAVEFAQEARGYALSALLDGLGLLSIAGYVRHLELAGTRSLPWLAAFTFSMIATASVHYTSLLFVAACFAALGWRLAATRPFLLREALVWIAVGLLTTLALTRLLILAASLSGSNNLVWIAPLTAWSVVSFFRDLSVPLPETGPLLAVRWGAFAALLLLCVGTLPRLRRDGLRFGVLVLIPSLYCALFIAASWLRPMLLARVASWLVIPFCLILAQAALSQPSRWRRHALCALPLLIFLLGLKYYYQDNEKEDWRGAARLVATQPRCTGPALIGEFNALGLYYYGVSTQRAAYVFLPDPRRRNSVEFNLSERLMHLPELDPGAVDGFIESHPGTVVMIRGESAELSPPDLQERLAKAPFKVRLDGRLLVACF